MKEKSISKDLGLVIKHFRTLKDFSQEELAYRSILHRTYIGAIERGEKCPTIDTLVKITTALEISLSKFFEKYEQFKEEFS